MAIGVDYSTVLTGNSAPQRPLGRWQGSTETGALACGARERMAATRENWRAGLGEVLSIIGRCAGENRARREKRAKDATAIQSAGPENG